MLRTSHVNYCYDKESQAGNIYSLYVAPKERRRGLGKNLVGVAVRALNKAHPLKPIRLCIHPFGSKKGLDENQLYYFYSKLGFKQIGISKFGDRIMDLSVKDRKKLL